MTDVPTMTDPNDVAPAVANLDTIVSLSKRRGFVFPSSEIYGGINAVWDYGPLGVELKNNVKRAWWRAMVQEREDIVGLDAGILMHPQVWVTSGHVGSFSDPLVECSTCPPPLPARRAAGRRGPDGDGARRSRRSSSGSASICPNDGGPLSAAASLQPDVHRRTWARSRTTRRSSTSGPRRRRARTSTSRTSSRARARRSRSGSPRSGSVPERDQPGQLRLPDARVRADGDAVLRPAGRSRGRGLRGVAAAAARLVRALRRRRPPGCASASTPPTSWPTTRRRRSTSSTASRSAGRSSRASTTAATSTSSRHAEASGENLEYFDPATEEHFIPWIVETAGGADRAAFTFLIDAYREEEVRGETRVVLGLHPELAPYKVAVLPLLKKRPEIVEICRKLRADLAKDMLAVYDDTAAIGKLYRRQDEIGTPWCITVDVDSLEDGAVTVRDRDAMTQERVPRRGRQAADPRPAGGGSPG